MQDREQLILKGYEYAKDVYAANGIDTDKVIDAVDKVKISMHCWQGDDVVGCETAGRAASGGIQTTGNYPGRARNAEELRSDISLALSLIPGATKLNLHANYAELNGKNVDRDAYTVDLFRNWMDFAKEKGIALDFNPTLFSHPMADSGLTLSSRDEGVRDFWVEHCKRCREIAQEFGKAQNEPSVVNFWMPDGFKDVPEDGDTPRRLMVESLDRVFADTSISEKYELDAVESKLFGIGLEALTVGSHELMYGYALTRKKLYTLDSGHFHPTEMISAKFSAIMQYMPEILLHVSRPMRWDSDHVVRMDDETQAIMNELVNGNYLSRTHIALDYFDASINRVAAWVIGMRNSRKALLNAMLRSSEALRATEVSGDYTTRLALQEEARTLPMGAVWDMYCLKAGVPVGEDWLRAVKQYEKDVLALR